MPGSVRVSVLEVVDLPLSLVGRTVQVRVALGKKEYKTKPVRAHGGRTPPWNADFAFPVLNLRDQLSITIVGSRGETMTKTEIEVASVVQNGFRDDFVALQGGGRIHLKLSFVLSEEERRRIEAMRVANQKKREQDALKARQNSTAENGNGKPWKAAVSAVTITEMTADADQEDKENEGRAGVVKPGKQQLKVPKPVASGEEIGTAAAVPLLSGESNVPVQQDAEEKGPTEPADSEAAAGEVIIDSQTVVLALQEDKSATTGALAAGEPEVEEVAKASESVGSEPSQGAALPAAYPAEQVVVEVSSPAVVAAEPVGVVAADASRAAPVTEEQFPLEHGMDLDLENLLDGDMGEEWMNEWMAEGAVKKKSLEEQQVVNQAMDMLTDKHEVEDVGPVQTPDERIQVDDCSTYDKGMVEQEGPRQVVGGATKDVEVVEEAMMQEQAVGELIAPAVVDVIEAPLAKSSVAESNPQIADKSLPFRQQLKAIQQRWEQDDDDDTGPREAPRSTVNSEETGDMSEEFQEQLRAIQEKWNDACGFQDSEDESDGDEDTGATEFLGKPDDKDQVGEELQEQLQAIEERWEDKASGSQGIVKDDRDDDDNNDGADLQISERDRPTEELVEQLKAIQKTWYVEDVSGLLGDANDGETDADEDENDDGEDGADVQGLLRSSGKSEQWDQPSDGPREELKAAQGTWENDEVTVSQGRGNETDCPLEDSVALTRDGDQLEEKASSSMEETTPLQAEAEPVVSEHPPQEAIQSSGPAQNLTKSTTTAREVHNVWSQGNDGRRGPNFGAIVAHFFGGAAIVAGAAAIAWSFGSRKHHVVTEGETLGTFAPSSNLDNSRFCKLNPGVCETSRVYPGQRLRLA